jgi:hypothetical protein
MALDFNNILNETIETVERPPIPPGGHYLMVVNAVPKITDREQYQIVDVFLKGVSAGDDVDPDLLKEYGKVDSVTARRSFIFNKEDNAAFQQTKFRLETFLFDHLGIELGVSLKEALNASVNKKVLVEIGARPDKEDPTVLYTDVKSTAKAE